MSRSKIAKKMIDYLEERINCENVMTYTKKYYDKKLGEGRESVVDQLMIDNTPVAFKIMKYNDRENYVRKESTDPKDRTWVKNLFFTFDFMTEANYTGFEYFPYLYGVLNCHEEENSRIYIYYEAFDGSLIDLFKQMEHASEWYDVVFQMIMINYYIEVVNGYRYNDGRPKNHLYRKYAKPFYKEYILEGTKFNINHKYLIVMWDFNYMEKITEANKNMVVSNIDFLLRYFRDNKDNIKIYPSARIIKLLTEVKNHPENTVNILKEYYTETN